MNRKENHNLSPPQPLLSLSLSTNRMVNTYKQEIGIGKEGIYRKKRCCCFWFLVYFCRQAGASIAKKSKINSRPRWRADVSKDMHYLANLLPRKEKAKRVQNRVYGKWISGAADREAAFFWFKHGFEFGSASVTGGQANCRTTVPVSVCVCVCQAAVVQSSCLQCKRHTHVLYSGLYGSANMLQAKKCCRPCTHASIT